MLNPNLDSPNLINVRVQNKPEYPRRQSRPDPPTLLDPPTMSANLVIPVLWPHFKLETS